MESLASFSVTIIVQSGVKELRIINIADNERADLMNLFLSYRRDTDKGTKKVAEKIRQYFLGEYKKYDELQKLKQKTAMRISPPRVVAPDMECWIRGGRQFEPSFKQQTPVHAHNFEIPPGIIVRMEYLD
jgi:hypothetical protein